MESKGRTENGKQERKQRAVMVSVTTIIETNQGNRAWFAVGFGARDRNERIAVLTTRLFPKSLSYHCRTGSTVLAVIPYTPVEQWLNKACPTTERQVSSGSSVYMGDGHSLTPC